MTVGEQTIKQTMTYNVEDARTSLAQNGKSFHWAAKLFAQNDADRVAQLYAFCRYADDIADNLDEVSAKQQLEIIASDLRRGHSQIPILSNLLKLLNENDTALRAAQILVASLLADTGKVRIQDWDDLIRYAYGVAGSVGIMMCQVLGTHDPSALPFAIDLGVGMQLTNIARDVVEDARRNRIYLPAEAFHKAVSPDQILYNDPRIRREVFAVIVSVLKRADAYYRSADSGMRYLPLRSRIVVLTAARIYEAIGPRILQNRPNYWRSRTVVSFQGKLYHTLRALLGLPFNFGFWHLGRLPDHDATLHTPLRGFPGADSEDI